MLKIRQTLARMSWPLMVASTLALVLAMSGGAYATSKYVITKSSQVKKGSLSASDLSNSAQVTLKGNRGVQGVAGVKGDKGDTGAQGAPGANGTNGAKGAQGPNGTDGKDGSNGIDGQSAFQLADFTGTMDQWLASLIGPQGPKGDQGAKGENGADSTVPGPMGAQGPKGDTGTTGADGAKGAAGTNGTNGAVGPIGPIGPKGATGPIGPAGPAGSPAGKPLWVTVSTTGATVDTNMNKADLYTGQQTDWFSEPQSPASISGYVVTFDRNVRGYSFQVTQDASTNVSEYNKPAMFIVRMADPMFTDYEAYVYAWSPTGVALSRGFTLTAYAPAA